MIHSWLFGDDAQVVYDREYQLLWLTGLLPVLGTALVSPILDSLIDPLNASPARIGLLVSVFTAPGVVLIPLGGALADRIGRKPVLVVGILVFGLAGCAIAFTADFRIVLLLRFLQGVGFAGIGPVVITSIGDLYSGAEEITAQGFRLTGAGLSGTVFPVIAGGLVVFSWQFPFLLYAVAIPIAVLVAIGLDEPRRADSDDEATPETGYLRALIALISYRRVLAYLLARWLPIVGWIGFLTYNSILVVRILGQSPFVAGVLVAVLNLVFALTASQTGRVMASVNELLLPLVAANGLIGIGFASFMLAPAVPVALFGSLAVGVGLGMTLTLYRSILTGLAPPALRGGLVSMGEAGGRLSATLTPIVMGLSIGALANTIGFEVSVRFVGAAIALFVGGGGIVLVVIAAQSADVGPAIDGD